MKVFVAGAAGAIGRELVPRLVEAGHEVHGMTRKESNRAILEELGAVPVVADALDAAQVATAVAAAEPDVIVHQLTAIGDVDTRHMEKSFAMTNRLRTEGTDHLLSAGQAVGVKRFVAQSHVMAYARTGGAVKTEEDLDDRAAPSGCVPTWRRSSTSRRRCWGRRGRRESCCAMAGSTAWGPRWRAAEVNGAPGILVLDGRERLFSVWALDIAGGEIVGVDAIVNPDKLRHLGPVADYEELRRFQE